MNNSDNLWGIDLGGTKIELAVLKKDSFEVIERTRIATEADRGYDHILSQIHKLIQRTEDKLQCASNKIGIGMPGTLDPESGLVKNSNTTCFNGRSLKLDLIKLCDKELFFANDANCFAVAESNLGIVLDHIKDPQIVFGIIMGTGVGGGLVINGKVWNGPHGIAGEWGHNHLDNSGGACYCGKTGCIETIISGPATERYYKSLSGKSVGLKEILKLQKAGDAMAIKTIDRLLHFFGKAVATIINVIDPDAIVLGGGLSNIDLLYKEGVIEIEKHIFNPILRTPILKPKLGDSAGVFGAALLGA